MTPRGQAIKLNKTEAPPAPKKPNRKKPIQLGENAPIRRLNFESLPESNMQAKQVPGD
jgi:hypothetical protein